MSNQLPYTNEKLYQYMLQNSLKEQPILKELRDYTSSMPTAEMQVSPEQGQLLAMLVKLLNAKKCLEIGTFTGYSAMAVALALPEDGRLYCFDKNEEWTDIAQEFWIQAGVAGKIDFTLGRAESELQRLLPNHQQSFDMIFIDADKINYPVYYELSLQLLRPGGALLIDDTLFNGYVIDDSQQQPATKAIRKLNKTIYDDTRVSAIILPIGNGLTLICRV